MTQMKPPSLESFVIYLIIDRSDPLIVTLVTIDGAESLEVRGVSLGEAARKIGMANVQVIYVGTASDTLAETVLVTDALGDFDLEAALTDAPSGAGDFEDFTFDLDPVGADAEATTGAGGFDLSLDIDFEDQACPELDLDIDVEVIALPQAEASW